MQRRRRTRNKGDPHALPGASCSACCTVQVLYLATTQKVSCTLTPPPPAQPPPLDESAHALRIADLRYALTPRLSSTTATLRFGGCTRTSNSISRLGPACRGACALARRARALSPPSPRSAQPLGLRELRALPRVRGARRGPARLQGRLSPPTGCGGALPRQRPGRFVSGLCVGELCECVRCCLSKVPGRRSRTPPPLPRTNRTSLVPPLVQKVPYTLHFMDDMVMTRPFGLAEQLIVHRTLHSRPDVIAFSLRRECAVPTETPSRSTLPLSTGQGLTAAPCPVHPKVTRCYATERPSDVPLFDPEMTWNWQQAEVRCHKYAEKTTTQRASLHSSATLKPCTAGRFRIPHVTRRTHLLHRIACKAGHATGQDRQSKPPRRLSRDLLP